MNTNLPLIKLIENLPTKTFQNLKESLNNILSIKEEDNLALIYDNLEHNSCENTDSILIDAAPSNNSTVCDKGSSQDTTNIIKEECDSPIMRSDLINSCKSVIIDKNNLNILCTQYNKIIYNEDAKKILRGVNWNQVQVQKCYEGTLINVLYHENKWYVTTRRCLDAKKSIWIKDISYYDLFVEAMENKFSFDDLNKNYCYHFVLLHHKNNNLINYECYGKDYKEIIHILTTEKISLREIEYEIKNLNYLKYEKFDSLEYLEKELQKISINDFKERKLSVEGYILKIYDGELNKSPFRILKLQTDIYEKLINIKPNNSNRNQCYLELYQKNRLKEYLPFFTNYYDEIVKRIHLSLQNISKEILNLYHLTRNKKNKEIYEKLPTSYKKILYDVHGIYINIKKKELEGNNQMQNYINQEKKTINLYIIYNHLKNISFKDLKQIFYDRMKMAEDNFPFINKNCINTLTQTKLMFK